MVLGGTLIGEARDDGALDTNEGGTQVASSSDAYADRLREAGLIPGERPMEGASQDALPEMPLGTVPLVAETEAGSSVSAEPVPPEPTPEQVFDGSENLSVHLTFYVCAGAPPGQSYCGTMASGATVYEGAAACGYALSLGTRFQITGDPTGRTYTCEDRGAGPYHWIDVFHYDYSSGRAWRNQFGQDVEIVLL